VSLVIDQMTLKETCDIEWINDVNDLSWTGNNLQVYVKNTFLTLPFIEQMVSILLNNHNNVIQAYLPCHIRVHYKIEKKEDLFTVIYKNLKVKKKKKSMYIYISYKKLI
jgi:hypothetical protein